MGKVSSTLTVFFEDPFWVGVFEIIEGKKLFAAKVTFGAEPKEYEVHEFIEKQYYDLQFSPAVTAVVKESRKNPKRLLHEAKEQTQDKGIGTKSQQALKLQQELNKLVRKAKSREHKEAENLRQFELKQQKKKEKHKGH